MTLVIFALCLARAAPPEGGASMLERIQALHTASLARIKTLQCRYRLVNLFDGKEEAGEYWRAGPRTKLTERLPDVLGGLTQMRIVVDGVRTSYGMRDRVRPGEHRTSATVDHADRVPFHLDVFGNCLAAFQGSAGAYHPLKNWLSGETQNPRASERGDRCVVVTADIPDPRVQSYKATIVFDPRCNYMATEVLYEGVELGSSVSRKHTVANFSEPLPGVFFPQLVVIESHRNGRKVLQAEYSLAELRINEPIDDAEFALQFAPGTRVFDRIRNVVYTTGADGKSVGDESPYERNPVPLPRATFPSLGEQGQSSANWLLIAAGVLAALAVGWVLVRRWRGSAAA